MAIIESGGKQYQVASGQFLAVDKLAAEAGATIVLDKVLAGGEAGQLTYGAPYLTGWAVEAKIIRHGKARKLLGVKKIPRHGYRRRLGHRQHHSWIEIGAIKAKVQAKAKGKSDGA